MSMWGYLMPWRNHLQVVKSEGVAHAGGTRLIPVDNRQPASIEFKLQPPVELTSALEDRTFCEVLDGRNATIKQVDERGVAHVVYLTPDMFMELVTSFGLHLGQELA